MPIAAFTIGSSVNAAVAAFSKALADRGKTDGVQVNTIHPSYVETERFWRRIKADMERTGQDGCTEAKKMAKAEGCNEAQGFLFSKPMPEREVAEFLAKRRRIADAA